MRWTPCSDDLDHDWNEGEPVRWCRKCGLTVHRGDAAYSPEQIERARARRVEGERRSAERRRDGKTHGRPWRIARQTGQTRCCYCRDLFAPANPPTFDHQIPASEGGTLADGWVLACQLCNSARATCPYDEYVAAVAAEHRRVAAGGQYRRPKWIRDPVEGYHLTVTPKSERRARRAARSLIA